MRTTPESRAQKILAETKAGQLPINVGEIALACGVSIKSTDLPENISGMLHKDTKTIFVNSGHHKNRKRFTIAHELGHFFLSSFSGIHVDKQVGFVFRDEDSQKAIVSTEIDANRFAAELLMPETLVSEEIKKMDKLTTTVEDIVDKLAKIFEVSDMAMTYKLKNLGIIL